MARKLVVKKQVTPERLMELSFRLRAAVDHQRGCEQQGFRFAGRAARKQSEQVSREDRGIGARSADSNERARWS